MASRYAIRQKALADIGFASYEAYLASQLWGVIKERVLARDRRKCSSCGELAYTAHHVTYSPQVLAGEDDTQLVSICRSCHRNTEFSGKKKLTGTGEIYKQFSKTAIRKSGGMPSKGKRKKSRPRCRCCQQQFKNLGRDDICLPCYRSGKALAFKQSVTDSTPTYPLSAHSVHGEIHESANDGG